MNIEKSIKLIEDWLEKPYLCEFEREELDAIIDVVEFAKSQQWQPIETAPHSNRSNDFKCFSDLVINHIDKYTVPQYGDSPDDLVEEWTVQQCVDSAKKYLARHGRNQREGQDELDLIKAAHYIQIAYTKLKK